MRSRRPHCSIAAIGLVAFVAVASRAAAQPDAGPAGDFYDRVAELRNRGNDAQAARLLEAEHELGAPHATARLSAELGLAHQGEGRHLDAEKHLVEALAASDDHWVEDHRDGLELALDYVESNLGWMVVQCIPRDADAQIIGDGRNCGVPFRIGVGEQTVEVRAPGYLSTQVVGHVTVGEHASVQAELETVECPSDGMLHIGGDDGGCCWPEQVWVDGSCAGAPSCPGEVSADGLSCVAPERDDGRLATFRIGAFGGITSFLRTDTSLFRSNIDAGQSSMQLGPRVELRFGLHLGSIFSLEVIAGGARQSVSHWLDCSAADSTSCVDHSPLSYTLDFGVMLQAHTNPRRNAGNFDFHAGIGARPWARIFLDDDFGGAGVTSTVVPAELGASVFVGSALSIDIAGQAAMWLPWEYCGNRPEGGEYCLDGDELQFEFSWSALAGVTLHLD